MRILVTGGNGQLGNELQRIIAEGTAEIGFVSKEYTEAEVVAVDANMLDVTDADAVASFISKGNFDLIVNCAAMTNVDGCEKEEEAAFRVNADGPANLARSAQLCGAKLVQVSTDYVFAGNDPCPRKETDPVEPMSAYGRTKLVGERNALALCERCFVVRTAWLYGYVGNNFVKTMLRVCRENGGATVVDDQLGNPTNANDLAYEILKIALTEDYGVYHCTDVGTVSWCGFAKAIVEEAGISATIVPCTSDQYAAAHPEAARRPLYSSLENAHLVATVGNEMRPWREALSTYIANLSRVEG